MSKVLFAFADQRNDEEYASNKKDNTADKTEDVKIFNTGGYKKTSAYQKKCPTQQVERFLSLAFFRVVIGRHG